MKKFLTAVLLAVTIISLIGTFACRTRSVGIPGAEPTATNTPIFGYTYDFEVGNTQGWIIGGDPGFTNAVAVNKSSVPGGTVPSGNNCVAITCNFAGTNAAGEFVLHPSPPDYTEGNTITARVYVPSGLPAGYSVQVFIMTMPGYAFTGNNVTAYTTGAWNTIVLPIKGLAQLNSVDTVAVQLLKNGSSDWTGTLFIDNIVIE